VIPANSLPGTAWRKSSYSSDNGGNCIEVVDGLEFVPVRDSKDEQGAALVFGPNAWKAFIDSL
jgi:hypothetical protein